MRQLLFIDPLVIPRTLVVVLQASIIIATDHRSSGGSYKQSKLVAEFNLRSKLLPDAGYPRGPDDWPHSA